MIIINILTPNKIFKILGITTTLILLNSCLWVNTAQAQELSDDGIYQTYEVINNQQQNPNQSPSPFLDPNDNDNDNNIKNINPNNQLSVPEGISYAQPLGNRIVGTAGSGSAGDPCRNDINLGRVYWKNKRNHHRTPGVVVTNYSPYTIYVLNLECGKNTDVILPDRIVESQISNAASAVMSVSSNQPNHLTLSPNPKFTGAQPDLKIQTIDDSGNYFNYKIIVNLFTTDICSNSNCDLIFIINKDLQIPNTGTGTLNIAQGGFGDNSQQSTSNNVTYSTNGKLVIGTNNGGNNKNNTAQTVTVNNRNNFPPGEILNYDRTLPPGQRNILKEGPWNYDSNYYAVEVLEGMQNSGLVPHKVYRKGNKTYFDMGENHHAFPAVTFHTIIDGIESPVNISAVPGQNGRILEANRVGAFTISSGQKIVCLIEPKEIPTEDRYLAKNKRGLGSGFKASRYTNYSSAGGVGSGSNIKSRPRYLVRLTAFDTDNNADRLSLNQIAEYADKVNTRLNLQHNGMTAVNKRNKQVVVINDMSKSHARTLCGQVREHMQCSISLM